MGNIRTPKTIYKNRLVITFKVIKKEVYYQISKWSEDGLNLAFLGEEKLEDNTPQQILNYALQTFTTVEGIKN